MTILQKGVGWRNLSWGIEKIWSAPADALLNQFSIDFDGSFIITGSDTNSGNTLNNVNRATFSYWVKSDNQWAHKSDENVFERRRNKAGVNDKQFVIAHGIPSLNNYSHRLAIFDAGGTNNRLDFEQGDNNDNGDTWQHVLYVYDGDEIPEDRIKLYITGTFMSGTIINTVPTSIPSSSAVFSIGGAWSGGSTVANEFGPGNVDEFAIWVNMAMSQSQIDEVYNNGTPSDLNNTSFANPDYWFRFGDDASDTATRLTDVANNESHYVIGFKTGSSDDEVYVEDTPP